MSYYKNYNFTSPEPIFALVKEELKSYFATGVIDDLLFPAYVEKCLSKLGRSTYKIEPAVLNIQNYNAELPSGFLAVREAWSCHSVYSTGAIKSPASVYEQVTIRVDQTPAPSICDSCDGMPNVITATYKTNDSTKSYSYQKQGLLKPGNISKNPGCEFECANYGSSSTDSFDVKGNKFYTTFCDGTVYLIYYKEEQDENENQMIPDDFRIKEFIEAFLKQKAFEQLSNTIVDETYNQVMQKAQLYQQKADEAYILATTEDKKWDIYDKQRNWIRNRNKNNRYKIANGSRR